MRNTLLAAVFTAIVVPAAAVADTAPSYNYLEGGYVYFDADGGGSADGFGVAGSYALNEQFHLLGGFQRVSDSGLSLNAFTVAGGYRFPLSGATDVVARAGLVRARVGLTGFGSGSENGWMAQGGVRSMLSPSLELNAFLTYTDVTGSEVTLGGGVVKTMNERIGLFANLETNDDGDLGTMIGVRFGF